MFWNTPATTATLDTAAEDRVSQPRPFFQLIDLRWDLRWDLELDVGLGGDLVGLDVGLGT